MGFSVLDSLGRIKVNKIGSTGPAGATGATGPAGPMSSFLEDPVFGEDGARGTDLVSPISRGGIAADVVNFVVAESIVASVSLQINPGDTIRFELFGSIANSTSGNRTYTLGIGISGVAGTSVTGSAVVATGTNTPVHIIGYMGCHSTSLVYASALASLNPVGAAGASVTSIPRVSWNTQAVDITGIQTCSIVVHSDAAGNGSTLHVAGFSIQKINV